MTATRVEFLRRTTQLLSRYGIETRGIAPVPAEERLETRWYQCFLFVFSVELQVNTCIFSTGTAGPVFFALGVRDSIILIVMVDLVKWLSPRLCSFPAFSYVDAIIPAILSVFSSEGCLILNCIIGGQMIASLSSELDDTLGIVIIGIISLVVTFCGYRVIHWYESIAWIPNGIAFITMLGYAGFDNSSSVGGLLYSVLLPTGAFGKILTILIALSIPSCCAPIMYTFSNSFMAVATWFAAGILMPVVVVGAKRFYTTSVDILNIIGYWSSAIILTEHDQYPITTWASYALLPSSIPAVVAFMCACGALVLFMSQAGYVGPVARKGSGDVSVFVGFVVRDVAYASSRSFEKMWYKKKILLDREIFTAP
ncbi:hypothetical protein EDB19DRAFT_1891928 [Suillus lakei]|nr:hypothetical protein EDB19DRAFT_1891928 [Suillus lakei]